MNLFDIKDPSFIKNLTIKELQKLAHDIRAFLIEEIPKTGGHLSSNLGTVELIIALHYVFDSPKDAFIFDVGHQAYTHKILTGRAKDFHSLRQTDGLSGYINYLESIHDQWESGHAGTSLSALQGFLYSQRLKGENGRGIAIIGDASITNGMAFEALNVLGSDQNVKGIIVLNDNEMGISKSVGAISKALTRIRFNRFFVKIKRFWQIILPKCFLEFLGRIKRGLKSFFQRQNIFEDLGYLYVGPIDGHDLKGLIYNFERIKRARKSVVMHILTDKGKGHELAEQDKIGTFHGVSKASTKKKEGISWSQGIANILYDLQELEKTFVIMPAMTVGTSFVEFSKTYKDRYIDVGIAEEHAASMAAMMAHQGIKVFLPLYATFSQRAFDQILNDIARSNHHVVFGIDRAGIVGEDGSTHQGIFDVSMFSLMPNMVITMPYDLKEAKALFDYAFLKQNHPIVIRYPRGMTQALNGDVIEEINHPSWVKMKQGKDLAIISYGQSLDRLNHVCESMELDATIINARFIKPIDEVMLKNILETHHKIFVYEEIANSAGLYPAILAFAEKHAYKNEFMEMSMTNQIIHHGNYKEIIKKMKMDERSIEEKILEFLK
ncbi:MAG: 1-deoxy-D-xylulose-5-phosphate synthase [Acholeplasmataceae bacterium]|nr:1-deoxy-D-xylulose-5-phosphate synthase [Acholeplasmataceae bacterium]